MPNDPDAASERVRVSRGEILVVGPGRLPAAKVKELLRRWYLQRALEVFAGVRNDSFQAWTKRAYDTPRIVVREVRGRWGSLSPAGQMTLNSRLVQAPRRCIEHVIVHELCHLAHRNHGLVFFSLLGRLMPDWEARKGRLEADAPLSPSALCGRHSKCPSRGGDSLADGD